MSPAENLCYNQIRQVIHMTCVEEIRQAVLQTVTRYPVVKVTLFGSQATGKVRPDSDVDLIVEFSEPISLLTLSGMKCDLEDILHRKVDLIHGPLKDTDIIEVEAEVVLYAA